MLSRPGQSFGRRSAVAEQGQRSTGAGAALADDDAALLTEQLHRAVARVCPYWHAVERDDVVQSAIVRVLELRRRNPDRSDLSFAYLRRVAYSAFIDEVRRRQRRGEVPLEDETEPVLASPRPSPERRSTGSELGATIRACLADLIRPRRLAVTLHLQGHTVPEIAQLLGWESKRAENLVYRGMADLRKCLAERGITS